MEDETEGKEKRDGKGMENGKEGMEEMRDGKGRGWENREGEEGV